MTYKAYGKHAVLIEWPARIDINILQNIILFKNKILNSNIKVIVDIINTYNSLTIVYIPTIKNIYSEILTLKSIYSKNLKPIKVVNYHWRIPVCYDLQFGLDLEAISIANKISIDEIIETHSNTIYTVFFVGFLPGFLYLGGLHKKLHFDRKSNPRLTIERGSVGIGGSQTGIYPIQSAGGWNIIGKSPISFFDIQKEKPCFAKSGDTISFIPINIKEFVQIENQISFENYRLDKSLRND